MRINRYLAAAGYGSRRACEDLVRAGKVSINGHFLRDLAVTVEPGDDVRVAGKPARTTTAAYLVLHKPRGVICSRSDERGRTTIFEYVPAHYGRLFHVGRLDKDSEGLIILTNDGALAQRLTHPSHEIEKEYEVVLDREFDVKEAPKLLRGFSIEGGRAKMERIWPAGPAAVRVVLRQGLKRQIRLMFYRLGYEVKRLSRVRIGPVEITHLPNGHWRPLKAREIALLAGSHKTKP